MNKTIIKILFLVLVGELTAQVPDTWAIDVHQFEHTMTVTAELEINHRAISNPSNVLVVFVGAECRGLVEATLVAEDDLFFLLIYANSDGEALEFRMWDAEVNNVIVLDQNASFVSGSALGTVDLPTLFTGINSVSFVDASDDEFQQMEDEVNNTALDILANDIYDESLALVVVNLVEPIHGFTIENLDQTFTYVSDENFFGADSFYYRVSHVYGSDSAWVRIQVQPVNDLPADFHLLLPQDEMVFLPDDEQLQNFSWEASIDLEDDPVTYTLYVWEESEIDTSYFSDGNSIFINVDELPKDTPLEWAVAAYDGWGMTQALDTFMVQIESHVGIDPISALPQDFQVNQNFPNPFNPVTKIEYGLPEVGDVSFIIHDLSGRTILDASLGNQNPGWYAFTWEGTGGGGEVVSSGVYLCQIQSGRELEVVKMIFLK